MTTEAANHPLLLTGKCPNAEITSAQGLLDFLLSQSSPDSRFISVEQDPNIASVLAVSDINSPELGFQVTKDHVVAVIDFTYEGRALRGIILMISSHIVMSKHIAGLGQSVQLLAVPELLILLTANPENFDTHLPAFLQAVSSSKMTPNNLVNYGDSISYSRHRDVHQSDLVRLRT